MWCWGVLDSMANIKDSQSVGNKSFRIELLLIQQVLVNTHTWIHQGHHRNVRPLQVAGFHHSSDSNTRMCWTECLCTMNRISCHLWTWDPNTSIQGLTCCSTFEQVVILDYLLWHTFFVEEHWHATVALKDTLDHSSRSIILLTSSITSHDLCPPITSSCFWEPLHSCTGQTTVLRIDNSKMETMK